MPEISTIQDAEEYIFNYNWYEARTRIPEEQYALLRSCEQLAAEHKHHRLLCRTRAYLTSYHTQTKDLQTALDLGLSNYKVAEAEDYRDELLLMFSFIITIYQLLGDYAQAEEYIIRCKEYVYHINNDEKKFSTHIVAAIQHYHLKNYTDSQAEFDNAIQLSEKLNDPYKLANLYNNYGNLLSEVDTAKAETVLRKGHELIQEARSTAAPGGFDNLLGLNLSNLALLYTRTTQLDKAEEAAQEAINILISTQTPLLLLETRLILADILLQKKEYTRCRELLEQVEQEAEPISAMGILLKGAEYKYKLYEQLKNYQTAFEYLVKHQVLKEKLFNEESAQKIRNLQISHNVRTINLERENAQAIARLKHDFLANMSHEIRTPVNAILGIAYLLEQGDLSDRNQDLVRRLNICGTNLLGIINDVLDISKIEAGKLELNPGPFSIQNTIRDVYDLLEVRAAEKKIGFEIADATGWDREMLILGDELRIRQILINLVSNAIKFTETGKVTIQLQESPGYYTIVIEDTGIGIPPERMERLFQRYEQASRDISAQFGGTGLGLAISVKLAEMMNGSLQAANQPENGTRFSLILPLQFAESTGLTQDPAILFDAGKLNGLNILIADDHYESREITAELIHHFSPGTILHQAENGAIAVEMAKSNPVDMILMDLDMPEKNGIEATMELRKQFGRSELKIIATTAGLLTLSREELLAFGFDDLVLKPFVPEQMIGRICSLL